MASLPFLQFFSRAQEQETKEKQVNPTRSFAAPENDDGAREIETMLDPRFGSLASVHTTTSDFQNKIKSTQELIKQYRSLSTIHEVDDAIQEIVDDAIVYEDGKEVVWLDLDFTKFSDNIKSMIDKEFENVVSILDFRRRGQNLFRNWYVDSRIYFHKVIDEKTNEIVELRRLDPLNLELIREVKKEMVNGTEVISGIVEYYIYRPLNDNLNSFGMGSGYTRDIVIPKDAIVFCHSGLIENCSNHANIIGYLHRAIKPANQLKMLEDSLVIYRLSRAPERRVFYVDVGNMPTRKAQQYVNNIMQGLKNRVVYDTTTGKVKNVNSNMAMLEDYYLPRREGSKGTEVTTLPAGQNLGDIADILYFNKKLYRAMHIPVSRASAEDQQSGVNFGQGSEITRDELKFTKFIRRLQTRFETILLEPLKHQLIVKKIITEEEWDKNSEKIHVVFNKDSYFEEQKDLEIFNARMAALAQAAEHVGKYYSNKYVMKNILRMSDDEMKEEQGVISQEMSDPRFNPEPSEF